MIEGIYHVSTASMSPKTQKLDIIANNLANVNTAGFKTDRVFLGGLSDADPSSGQNRLLTTITEYRQGALHDTGNDLDLGIKGEGFFAVETPDGVGYTRNGSFALDSEGWLVNSEGMPVLGWGGPIEIIGSQVTIGENGDVSVDGKMVDTLMIIDFAKPYRLKKVGNSLLIPLDPMEAGISAEHARVKQGFLEGSNVRTTEEMMDMMSLYRTYEAAQKTIKYQDETLGKAVNDVGRVA